MQRALRANNGTTTLSDGYNARIKRATFNCSSTKVGRATGLPAALLLSLGGGSHSQHNHPPAGFFIKFEVTRFGKVMVLMMIMAVALILLIMRITMIRMIVTSAAYDDSVD